MYNVVLATENDFEAIMDMSRKFYASTHYADVIDWHEDSAAVFIFDLLDNGFILLAKKDEETVGMIACKFTHTPANMHIKICSETMWWMEPEYRGGRAALMLLKNAEDICKYEECKMFTMSSLATSPKGIDGMLKKLGWNHEESAYIKRI